MNTDAVAEVSIALVLNRLLFVSGSASAIVLVVLALRTRRPRVVILTLLIVLVAGWIVRSAAPAAVEDRGDAATMTLLLSYVAMVLGMTAHYVYIQAQSGARKLKFNWLSFVMPILASPIVFIPLVSLAGQVPAIGGAFTQAKVMVYLVAFQNGFFWKHFFDQRKSDLAPSRTRRGPAPPAASRPAGV
jgi:hypothetical protein